MAKPALDVVRRHEAAAPERAPEQKVPGGTTPTSTRAKLLGTGLVVGAGLGAYALLRDSRPPAYTIKYVSVPLAVTTGTEPTTKTDSTTVQVRVGDTSCSSSTEHYRAAGANGQLVVLDYTQRVLVCAIRAHTNKAATRIVATYEGATLTQDVSWSTGTLEYTPSGDPALRIRIQNTPNNLTQFI
jgi:hypothetical protein